MLIMWINNIEIGGHGEGKKSILQRVVKENKDVGE